MCVCMWEGVGMCMWEGVCRGHVCVSVWRVCVCVSVWRACVCACGRVCMYVSLCVHVGGRVCVHVGGRAYARLVCERPWAPSAPAARVPACPRPQPARLHVGRGLEQPPLGP